MKPSLSEMLLSQILYFTIAIVCGFTAFLFYKMVGEGKDKLNGTRSNMIWLFVSLSFSYGLDGLYWLLWDTGVYDGVQPIWIRLVRNLPFTFVTIRLGWYIGKVWLRGLFK